MNNHISYFKEKSFTSSETVPDDEWVTLENHALALEDYDSFTEYEARNLFESVNDDFNGIGSFVSSVLVRSEGYPQQWIFDDKRDESSTRDTATFMRDLKMEAFAEDNMQIKPFPSEAIGPDPIGWMKKALKIDTSKSLTLEKIFVYSAVHAFKVTMTWLTPSQLQTVREAYEKMNKIRFASEWLDSSRLIAIRRVEATLNWYANSNRALDNEHRLDQASKIF